METKQNVAFNWPVWMPNVDDGRVGETGLTLAISVSKAGGAFSDVTAGCTVTERGNGWYDVAHASGHADTLGVLSRRVTATGATERNEKCSIVSKYASDALQSDSTILPATLIAAQTDVAAVAAFVDTEIQAIIDALGSGTYGLAALDTDLNTLLTRLTALRAGYMDNLSAGAVALQSALEGDGSESVILQFYITDSTTPIPSARVTVMDSSDSAFLTVLTTTANGQAPMARDAGTYKLRVSCPGYTFTNPMTLTVSASGTYTFYGDAISIPAPGAADSCTVALYCYQPGTETPITAVVAKAKIISLPFNLNGKYYSGQQFDGTYTVVTGLLTFMLPWGAKVDFDIRHINGEQTIRRTIPSLSTVMLEDIAA